MKFNFLHPVVVAWRRAFFAASLISVMAPAFADDLPLLDQSKRKPQWLTTLEGTPQRVVLVGLDDQRMRYRVASLASAEAALGDTTTPVVQEISWGEIVSWGRRRDFRTASQALLRDGGVLVADLLQVEPHRWTWGEDPLAFGSVRPIFLSALIPREAMAGAIFGPPTERLVRDRLALSLREAHASDEVWIEQGNSVKARIDSTNSEAGEGGMKWRMRIRERAVAIDHSRVQAVRVANEASSDSTPPQFMLGFLDGSFVLASDLAEDDQVVQIQLAGGGTIRLARPTFYDELCLVRPLHQRVLYLSDQAPKEHRHQPFLTLDRPLRRNQNVLGGLPRWGDHIFTKAFGVSSRSFVVYEIPSGWQRIASEVALDLAAKNEGSVVFRIFIQSDTEPAWRPAATTKVVRGSDAPTTLSAELNDATRAAFIVDYGPRGDVMDYANWLNVRLEK